MAMANLCPQCGIQNVEDGRFCQSCGASIMPEGGSQIPQEHSRHDLFDLDYDSVTKLANCSGMIHFLGILWLIAAAVYVLACIGLLIKRDPSALPFIFPLAALSVPAAYGAFTRPQ